MLFYFSTQIIWTPDGIVENVKSNQCYFLIEFNHIEKKIFDKMLANISPCFPARMGFSMQRDDLYSVKLHPTHGFMWDHEVMGDGHD